MLTRVKQILSERPHFADDASWLTTVVSRVSQRSGVGVGRVARVRVRNVRDPLLVRLGTTDCMVLQEMFAHAEYARALALLPRSGAAIVDLGTNVGLSLRVWLNHCPDARIAAVEPDPQNMALARRNVDQTHAAKQVTFLQTCVAGTRRGVALDRTDGAWGFKLAEARSADAAEMTTITVPDVLEAAGFTGDVDLFKCDIEGAEAEVFADCRAWINRCRVLVVETHAPYTGDRLLADLERNGARLHAERLKKFGQCEVLMLTRAG